jgi:hypothetical protein
VASLAFGAACGGDDGDSDDATAEGSTTTTSTTRTPRASGTGTGTPDAESTTAPVATVDPNGPDGIPNTDDDLVDPEIGGGDPNAAPQVVATAPPVTPAAGVTPVTDPTTIAPPQASGELRAIVDADASTPGIQSTRDVNVGGTIRVAVVIVNVPPLTNDLGGVSAFNFILNYDKTKIFAPTITGGPATQRNPFANIAGLDQAANWDCLPAPEGDLDDPGGVEGDGSPETGQAFLSCFTFSPGTANATLVLGVVTFNVIASGTVTLSLSNFEVGDSLGLSYGQCPGDAGALTEIACETATLNVN